MKKIIMATMLLVNVTISTAQIVVTPAAPHVTQLHPLGYQRPLPPGQVTYDSKTPYVLNLYFTLINNGDNHNSLEPFNVINTPELVELKFQECVRYLNVAFNPYNIFFKYAGLQIVQNQFISTGDLQFTVNPYNIPVDLLAPNDLARYKKINAMNLFFSDGIGFDEPVQEEVFLGYNASTFTTPILNDPNLEHLIVHKMGHNLGLYDIFEPYSHFESGDILHDFTSCEHVTRNENDAAFNADIAGDEVIDTPAQPKVSDSFFVGGCSSYIFDLNKVNCVSEPYENIVNGNYMGDPFYTSGCPYSFTPGQARKMREFILNDHFTGFQADPYFNDSVAPTRNTVASLYEPYDRRVVPGETIVSTTDNGNGTITVCRNMLEQQKFQEGFDYIFPENESPDPLIGHITDIPVVSHHTFDYPVTILQLAPGQTNLSTNSGTAHLTCTRGLVCTVENIVRGSDTRVKVLGSMNLTEQQFDAIQINDPDLYDKLLVEYFHILEKYTASGAKTQEIFYKY